MTARTVRRWLAIPAGALFALLVSVAATALPDELREPVASGSVVVEDRNGRPLREVRASDGTRARWVPSATSRRRR